MDCDLTIRVMTPADLPAVLSLREQAGWSQTSADLARYLAWQPDGCFVAVRGRQVIASAGTTIYEPHLGWIGLMLVDAAERGRGIGRALLLRSLDWLERERGLPTVGLDATPAGRPLYAAHGFVEVGTLRRWQGPAPAVRRPALPRPLRTDDLPRLASLDRAARGADRLRLLRDLVADHPDRCHLLADQGRVRGYLCTRPRVGGWYLGPLVAADVSAADLLLRAGLADLADQAIALDVPDDNLAASDLLASLGLSPIRPFTRMIRGPLPPWDPALVYGLAGPELG